MSDEKGQTAEEKKGREAAEEASALDKLTDRVGPPKCLISRNRYYGEEQPMQMRAPPVVMTSTMLGLFQIFWTISGHTP